MRKLSVFSMIVFGLTAVGIGCSSPPSQHREPRAAAESTKPAPAANPRAGKFTRANNPTTLAGRGEPNLEDKARPAAWVYVDGQAGKFTERDGEPLTQWVVEGPVCATPTFRVEGYEPLLGNPMDFKCVLQAVESSDGSTVVYGIAANEGTFTPGREYPLLNPGDNFIIRNGLTGDIVKEISPLAPGTYVIVGGLENRSTGKRALAVTYFTVGEDK
ncbi:MAG: hypothetical protein AAB385_01715 [Planctomycetota bacterium]